MNVEQKLTSVRRIPHARGWFQWLPQSSGDGSSASLGTLPIIHTNWLDELYTSDILYHSFPWEKKNIYTKIKKAFESSLMHLEVTVLRLYLHIRTCKYMIKYRNNKN